jgi:hypothetical protein
VSHHRSSSGHCDCWLVQQLRPLHLMVCLTCVTSAGAVANHVSSRIRSL